MIGQYTPSRWVTQDQGISNRVRREIDQTAARQRITEIQLSAAVPQAFATLLGRRFNALPPIQVYENDLLEYRPSSLPRPQ
jgi:hypothetical protein